MSRPTLEVEVCREEVCREEVCRGEVCREEVANSAVPICTSADSLRNAAMKISHACASSKSVCLKSVGLFKVCVSTAFDAVLLSVFVCEVVCVHLTRDLALLHSLPLCLRHAIWKQLVGGCIAAVPVFTYGSEIFVISRDCWGQALKIARDDYLMRGGAPPTAGMGRLSRPKPF